MSKKKQGGKIKYVLYLCMCISVGICLFIMRIDMTSIYSCMVNRVINISGFKINRIEITGASSKVTQMICRRIHINKGDSILSMSSADVYKNVCDVSWVKEALVQKRLPNIIAIKVTEATPIAVYQHEGKSILIDADGEFLEEVSVKPQGIPLVAGAGANKEVSQILQSMKQYPDILAQIEALIYIRERRWDMTISGVRVKLPETNMAAALSQLDTFIKSGFLNKSTYKQLDFRYPGQVTVG